MLYTKLRRIEHSTTNINTESIKKSISSLTGYKDTDDFYKSVLIVIHPDFNVFTTSSISSSVISGGENGIFIFHISLYL